MSLREVRDVMRSRTRDEWLARFADADVCLTTIYTPEEVAADPHVAARGVMTRVEDRACRAARGEVRAPGARRRHRRGARERGNRRSRERAPA